MSGFLQNKNEISTSFPPQGWKGFRGKKGGVFLGYVKINKRARSM